MSKSIKKAQDENFDGIQCMALSYFTQKICRKQGFQELFSIKYGEYRQNEKQLFDAKSMGLHQEGTLFIRKF